MALNLRRGARAVGSGALALALVAGWSLALQGGDGTVRVFAQGDTDPVNLDPLIDPDVNPSTISYIASDGTAQTVEFDSLLEVGGADVGVDTIGGTVCATTGVETVGAGCVAGAAIIAAPALYKGGKMIFHAIWGSSHSSGTPTTANGIVSGYGFGDPTLDTPHGAGTFDIPGVSWPGGDSANYHVDIDVFWPDGSTSGGPVPGYEYSGVRLLGSHVWRDVD